MAIQSGGFFLRVAKFAGERKSGCKSWARLWVNDQFGYNNVASNYWSEPISRLRSLLKFIFLLHVVITHTHAWPSLHMSIWYRHYFYASRGSTAERRETENHQAGWKKMKESTEPPKETPVIHKGILSSMEHFNFYNKNKKSKQDYVFTRLHTFCLLT